MNADELSKYYNWYNMIEKINIEEVRCITEHTLSVNSLLPLKDKRIASCSEDNTIRIYDPSNDYHCDQVINRQSQRITSICELDDGILSQAQRISQ